MIAPTGHVVVVSPHLDDAVLSLGAAIAQAVRAGAQVEVLTVFAGDPDSTTPAGRWDAWARFGTEGAASRALREEDRKACAIIGATPVWLRFGDKQYGRNRDEAAVYDAVLAALDGRDAVLLPGYPLAHGDHRFLSELLVRRGIPYRHVGLYMEQPYAVAAGGEQAAPEIPACLRDLLPMSPSFEPVRTGARDRVAKWRALRKYRSQLPLLKSVVRSRTRVRAGHESVAWLPGR